MTGPESAAAHAAALAGLPGMHPVRLAGLLDRMPPTDAWEAVRSGTHPADPRRRFTRSARATHVDEVGERYLRAGVSVLLRGSPGYPSALAQDPCPPAVLFALGDYSVVEGRHRVAVVGTRSPTPYGQGVASELASDLAAGGVVVVSGLAGGIEASAHVGVLRCAGPSAAPSAAVVGTGLDRPSASPGQPLWDEVVTTGVVFSETALGSPSHPGAFPAARRIIAGLADVVVVVESRHQEGTDVIVDAAARRSVPVCAVPGSVRSRASDVTNQLVVDGCAPVRDATDVLVAVYLARAGRGRPMEPGGPDERAVTVGPGEGVWAPVPEGGGRPDGRGRWGTPG